MGQKIAQFRFNGYKVLDASITLADTDNYDINLDIDFTDSQFIDDENGKFRLELSTIVHNNDNSIMVKVKTMAEFEFDKDIDKEMKKSFCDTNAPAIIFPYIRAYISTLTALSGINAITLPTLNLSK